MHSSRFTFQTKKLIILWVMFELIFWLLIFGFIRILTWVDDTTLSGFTFLNAKSAWLLIIVPIYYLVQLYWISDRNKKLKPWLGNNNNEYLFQSAPQKSIFWRVILIRNIFVFIVFALMQPVFGKETQEVNTSDIELVFALDISNSMNVMDIDGGKSRLALAKKIMQQTIGAAPVAKVGILVFAGSVYPHLPLTPDKRAAKVYAQQIETDIMSHQGTNIGVALMKSTAFFSEETYRRLVVLITDGEDHEGMIEDGLEALNSKDATLFIYGIGSQKGGLVPVKPNNKSKGYLKDDMGNPAHSKLNKKMIAEIASKAGGDFKILNTSFPDISDVLTVINNKKASNTVALTFEIEVSKYHWPLAIALMFVLIFIWHEVGLNWTRWKK